MSDKSTDKVVPEDALLQSFTAIINFFSIKADLQGMIAGLSREEATADLAMDEVAILANQMGFELEVKPVRQTAILKSKQPMIVLSDTSGPVVIYPQRTHKGKAFLPGAGLVALEDVVDLSRQEELEAVIFTMQAGSELAHTEHMYKKQAMDWFWGPIFSNWRSYSDVIICTVIINLFVIALPLYTMSVYDRVMGHFVEETLIVLTIGIMVTLVFDFFFKSIRSYLLDKIALKLGRDYDHKLMKRLVSIHGSDMPMTIGERANIFKELQSIRDFYATKLTPALFDFPFFLLFVFVIYLIAPVLAIIPLIAAVLLIAINLWVQVPINRATKEYFSATQVKSSSLIEMIQGISAIQIFNAMGARLFKWQNVVDQASEQARYNHFLMSLVSNFSHLISHITHISVVFFGVYLSQMELLTVGGMIACSILSGRALSPIVQLSGLLAQYKQSKDVLGTIDQIFQLPHQEGDQLEKEAKGPFKGAVSVKDVSFQYPKQSRHALSNINLMIKPGEKVGFIGRSGAGKSTLAKIITGQLKAQQGEMIIDQYGYETVPVTELRRHIGLVPQQSDFFIGSIRENIVLNTVELEEEKLAKAISVSGLDVVLAQENQGLDMEVGEGGMQLSGGQKQAVSVARALVHDPKILVFDEPSNGMDNALEEKMRTELKTHIEDKTFILVTHRTSLLSLVDRLVVLDQGRIIGDGPRDEILKKLSAAGKSAS